MGKNMVQFLHSREVLDDKRYLISGIPCLSSEEDTTEFCCGMSELAIDESSIIIDLDTTITHGNTIHHVHSRHSCDLANNVYLTGMFPPSAEHFSGQGYSASNLQVNILQGGLQDTQQRRVTKQKLMAKFGTHEDGLNRDL
eukprot:g25991.t1